MTTSRGWGATEEEIYEAFLSNTPQEKQEEFRCLYREFHGRPYSDTDRTDREALVALYKATDGANWRNNDNWLTDAPIHEWRGVTTSDITGRVSSLGLSGNNLDGPIPPDLGSLSNLKYLYLQGNQLTGTIPPGLGSLTKLQDLNLGGNQLTGRIPAELGDLSGLFMLSLSGNSLTGQIPPELGRLTQIEGLFLQSNELTGEVPPKLSSLAGLSHLVLHDNRLTGCIPNELRRLVTAHAVRDQPYFLHQLGLPLC